MSTSPYRWFDTGSAMIGDIVEYLELQVLSKYISLAYLEFVGTWKRVYTALGRYEGRRKKKKKKMLRDIASAAS